MVIVVPIIFTAIICIAAYILKKNYMLYRVSIRFIHIASTVVTIF